MKKLILTIGALACMSLPVNSQTASSPVTTPSNEQSKSTQRRVVKIAGAPPSSTPLSPAIVAGELVFTSGQIGIDPKTGQMVAGGTAEQAEQVLLTSQPCWKLPEAALRTW